VEKHYQIPQVQIAFCTYQTHPACWTTPALMARLKWGMSSRSLPFSEPCSAPAVHEPWAQSSNNGSLGNIVGKVYHCTWAY